MQCFALFKAIASLLLFFFVLLPRAILYRILSFLPLPGIHSLVRPRSVSYMTWDYDKSSVAVIVCTVKVCGRHEDTENAEAVFGKLVLKYPLLTTYPGSILTFPCWKIEKNFQLREHIFLTECQTIKDLSKLRTYLLRRPFPSRKSPWEVHLVNICGDLESSYILFRVHHSLADGYSLINILREVGSVEGERQLEGKSMKAEPALFQNLLAYLAVVWNLYSIITWKGKDFGYNCQPGRIQTAEGSPVPLKLIKEGKNLLGTSFQVFLLTALQATMTEWRERRGIPGGIWPCFFPVSVPGGGKGVHAFENKLSYLSVPISTIKDEKGSAALQWEKHVKGMDAYFRSAGWERLVNHHAFNLLGFLPLSFLKGARDISTPLCLSDFPVLYDDILVLGKPCLGLRFNLNFNEKNGGAVFSGLSYKDEWVVSLTASKEWCGTELEAQELVDLLVKKVRELNAAARSLQSI